MTVEKTAEQMVVMLVCLLVGRLVELKAVGMVVLMVLRMAEQMVVMSAC